MIVSSPSQSQLLPGSDAHDSVSYFLQRFVSYQGQQDTPSLRQTLSRHLEKFWQRNQHEPALATAMFEGLCDRRPVDEATIQRMGRASFRPSVMPQQVLFDLFCDLRDISAHPTGQAGKPAADALEPPPNPQSGRPAAAPIRPPHRPQPPAQPRLPNATASAAVPVSSPSLQAAPGRDVGLMQRRLAALLGEPVAAHPSQGDVRTMQATPLPTIMPPAPQPEPSYTNLVLDADGLIRDVSKLATRAAQPVDALALSSLPHRTEEELKAIGPAFAQLGQGRSSSAAVPVVDILIDAPPPMRLVLAAALAPVLQRPDLSDAYKIAIARAGVLADTRVCADFVTFAAGIAAAAGPVGNQVLPSAYMRLVLLPHLYSPPPADLKTAVLRMSVCVALSHDKIFEHSDTLLQALDIVTAGRTVESLDGVIPLARRLAALDALRRAEAANFVVQASSQNAPLAALVAML